MNHLLNSAPDMSVPRSTALSSQYPKSSNPLAQSTPPGAPKQQLRPTPTSESGPEVHYAGAAPIVGRPSASSDHSDHSFVLDPNLSKRPAERAHRRGAARGTHDPATRSSIASESDSNGSTAANSLAIAIPELNVQPEYTKNQLDVALQVLCSIFVQSILIYCR